MADSGLPRPVAAAWGCGLHLRCLTAAADRFFVAFTFFFLSLRRFFRLTFSLHVLSVFESQILIFHRFWVWTVFLRRRPDVFFVCQTFFSSARRYFRLPDVFFVCQTFFLSGRRFFCLATLFSFARRFFCLSDVFFMVTPTRRFFRLSDKKKSG